MERIKVANLKPGQVFDKPVFSTTGQKLLNAGVSLTDRQIAAILRAGELEVYAADSVIELEDAGLVNRCDVKDLAVGQKAKHGVVSQSGNVVIEAGEQIEEHHVNAIAASGGVFLTTRERANQRRERIMLAENLVEQLDERVRNLQLRVKPLARVDWLEPLDDSEWPDPDQLQWSRDQHVEQLTQFFARIEAGVQIPVEEFDGILDDLFTDLKQHPARFTQLALLVHRREDYLPDHAYTVAVLAMATAYRLRWPADCVREIGLTGLLFDIGMLLVPQRVRVSKGGLTDVDRSRVQQHPLFSLSMLQSVETAPLATQLAAVQHHERENGSGYPRGLRKDNICDYARVIAVADTFAATTEPRHYRKPKLPYIAMEELLRAASGMVYWTPAVRALIQAAGLFPVGSYVRLTDRRAAHILAANPEQIDRPLIQPLDEAGNPEGEPIDLAQPANKTVAVARPIAGATG